MRKRLLFLPLLLILNMFFIVGLPAAAAQDTNGCTVETYTFGPSELIGGPFEFSLIFPGETAIYDTPGNNKSVRVDLWDDETGMFISSTFETLPYTISNPTDHRIFIAIVTADFKLIDWTITMIRNCRAPEVTCPIGDGRLNSEDCGALAAIYPNGTVLDIYGIDPASGEGVLVFSFDLSTAGDVTENTLLAEGVNPFNGQPIRLYKLAGGGYQLNSTQPNGEPYEFAWS